jgi:histidinol dehydrogenase
MKILNAKDTDLAAALRELSKKLDPGAGITSAASDAKTIEVFGEPLSPREVVHRIMADVREKGDAAIVDYVKKFDGADITPDQFRVTEAEIEEGYAAAPQALKDAMERSAENIRQYQAAIKITDPAPVYNAEGGKLWVRYSPLDRAGLYVPGGMASYPSSVLMTAVPAQVAGVESIVMCSPCGPDGKVRPEALAAARIAGVTEILRIGGVPAIAAMAYGTEAIESVAIIVGPGNSFVTAAKKEAYGAVTLDMLAGPSEILIIADSSANPRFLAADLLSQAEHNPAASVLLTPDAAIAEATMAELEKQLPELSREDAARDCLEKFGFIGVTNDLDEAVALANQFAPEHLELAVDEPEALLENIRNAGAVFMGHWTPEPVGDYMAGPSHVLPTGGSARFFSGLSVNDFLRRTSVLQYSREALKKTMADVDLFARSEGLDAHARAAMIRAEGTDEHPTSNIQRPTSN